MLYHGGIRRLRREQPVIVFAVQFFRFFPMLMLCWIYCIPFALFMYYAAAPLVLFFSAYVLKRGICRDSLLLRYAAVFMAVLAAAKIFLLDMHSLSMEIACRAGEKLCGSFGSTLFQAGGVSLFALAAGGLYMLGKRYGSGYKPKRENIPQNDRDLRLWANSSLFLSIFLCCWLAAPFTYYLIFGSMPEIFFKLRWQYIAVLNFVTLAVGFWRIEDYYLYYNPDGAKNIRQRDAGKTWVPADTLWTVLPIYLVALASGVMSDDLFRSL